MTRIAVMGAGSWGTAFAMALADADAEAGAGGTVRVWGRRPGVCAEITDQHRNSAYLEGVELPPGLVATPRAEEALDGAEIVVLAVPSQSLRDNLEAWRAAIPAEAVLVSLMKGIELGGRLRMSEVIGAVLEAPPGRVAVVSGPNLALEIALRQPAGTVVASADPRTAERVARACTTAHLRPYTNTDVVGVELGGAVKNVIALAVGIAEGMGFGDNTKATLITRGLAETTRLGLALGADPATLAGLAGLGDLVATCASPLSRNRTFGVAVGRGQTVAEATAAARFTAEAVKSCRPIRDLAHALGVEMPITEAVVAVVHEGLPLSELGTLLLGRPRRPERV